MDSKTKTILNYREVALIRRNVWEKFCVKGNETMLPVTKKGEH
jgi:hypothetical protein